MDSFEPSAAVMAARFLRGRRSRAALAFRAHGVGVRVDCDDAALVAQITDRLPVGSVRNADAVADVHFRVRRTAAHLYRLHVGEELVAHSLRAGELLDMLEGAMTLHVAERAPRHVFVHAGAVRWNGRLVLFPGYSFSGKTTLVADLVRAGAEYYSDEYAVIDEMGLVHPYPRALQMRTPGDARQTRLPVEALGGRAATAPDSVAMIVFARYATGATWTAREVSRGNSALELFSYTISAQRAPAAALRAFERITRTATSYAGTRGETEQIASFLTKLLGN